jgi:hypothetical protein
MSFVSSFLLMCGCSTSIAHSWSAWARTSAGNIPSAADAASGTYAGTNKKMKRPDVAEKMTSALKLISFHL